MYNLHLNQYDLNICLACQDINVQCEIERMFLWQQNIILWQKEINNHFISSF